MTDADIKLMQRVLGAAAQSPNLIPDTFMAYLFDFIQTQRLQIPIGQVFGFKQFTMQIAPRIDTSASTSLTAYGDLSDATGPTLDGLPDGEYLLLYGGQLVSATAGVGAKMSIEVNGVPATDTDAVLSAADRSSSGITAVPKTLANGGSNKIVSKYASGTGGTSVFFAGRWMLALKYDN